VLLRDSTSATMLHEKTLIYAT